MNRSELVSKLSESIECSKKDADAFVGKFVEVVTEELVNKGEVNISGFGKFATAEVPERKGIVQLGSNKGNEYVTPAHVKPTFKFGKAVKDAVKGE